jgi:ribose 5-phosphate isomerase B
MKIYLGSDHAGFELKEMLKTFLSKNDYEVEDLGPHEYIETDDYPDFVRPVAEAVAREPESRGVVIGKSGQGEAMVANRVRGVRAAVYYGHEPSILKLSREHNDANVLALASGFLLTDEDAKSAVELWLKTPFSGAERHMRRIAKLDL